MSWLAREVRCLVYAMASWHLFQQSRFMAWAIPRMGAFSVYREGVDRQAINLAIEILETAARPLVIFPEGAVSRTNDHLHALWMVSPFRPYGSQATREIDLRRTGGGASGRD